MVGERCVYLEMVVNYSFGDSALDHLVSCKKKGKYSPTNVSRDNCHYFGGFLGNNRCKPWLLVAIAAFIGLPVSEWLGLYDPQHWSNIYSYVIVIVIYLIADFVSRRSSFEKL